MVDLRRGSPSFGRWCSVELSADKPQLLWIPYGFAHGFCVMGNEEAELLYKVTGVYNPASEGGLIWNDADVNIRWPLEKPLLSHRDAALPALKRLEPLNPPL